MKLPRYSSTALPQTVNLSPQMAGAAAAARGQIGEAAVKTALQGFDLAMAVRDASDAATFDEAAVNAKVGTRSVLESEDWNKTEVAGKPTEEAMRTEYAKQKSSAYASLNPMKGKRAKEEATRKLDLYYVEQDFEFEQKAIKHQIQAAATKTSKALQTSIEQNDFVEARRIATAARTNGHIDDVGAMQIEGNIVAAEMDYDAEVIASTVDEAYMTGGKDAGEQAYAEVLTRKYDSPEARGMAIDKAEEKRTEWNKAFAATKTKIELEVLEAYGDHKRAATDGEMTMEHVDALYQSVQLGFGEAGVRRRDELRTLVLDAQERQIQKYEVGQYLDAGVPLPDTPEARQGLNEIYRERVNVLRAEGGSVADAFVMLGDISATSGIMPPDAQATMAALGRTDAGLATAAGMYNAVTSGGTLPVMDKVEPQILDAASMIRNGVPPEQAAEIAWANQYQTPEQKAIAEELWKDNGDTVRTKHRSNMMDSVYDPSWASFVPDIPVAMQIQYDEVYKQIYDATKGNDLAAASGAKQSVAAEWKLTRLNGDWEIQKYGIEGDAREARNRIKARLKERTDLMGIAGEPADLDSMYLIPTGEYRGEEQKVNIFVSGMPLMSVTEVNGVKTQAQVVYWMSTKSAQEFTDTQGKREELEKTLKEQKSESNLKRLQFEQGKNPQTSIHSIPHFTPSEAEIKDIDSAAALTQKALDELPSFNP